MKTYLITLMAFLVAVNVSLAQKVKGSGQVIKIDLPVEDFDKLDIRGGAYNLYLVSGNEPGVVVETDDNLLEMINAYTEGDELILKWEKKTNLRKVSKFNVYVTYTKLNRLKGNLVGNIKCENTLNVDHFDIDLSGVGNADLMVEAKSIKGDISRVGNVHMSGKSDHMDMDFSGTGNLNAYDLKVGELHIQKSGVGNVKVHADNEIHIDASGVGNLYYRGDASIERIHSSAIGKVKKA
jgi:hypothetical protein